MSCRRREEGILRRIAESELGDSQVLAFLVLALIALNLTLYRSLEELEESLEELEELQPVLDAIRFTSSAMLPVSLLLAALAARIANRSSALFKKACKEGSDSPSGARGELGCEE